MNATVLHILRQAVDDEQRREQLRREAVWTAEDVAAVDRATSQLRAIDDERWR